MKVILIIAQTGQGKSTLCKHFILEKNCAVFDVNNEYGLEPYSKNNNGKIPKRFMYYGDHERYITICGGLQNSVCIFEEATGFLGFNTEKNMRALLVNKRHTNNYYILIFHDINSVPKFILGQANIIILFKTGDSITDVIKKGKRNLREAFEKVKTLPNFEWSEQNKLPKRDENYIQIDVQ